MRFITYVRNGVDTTIYGSLVDAIREGLTYKERMQVLEGLFGPATNEYWKQTIPKHKNEMIKFSNVLDGYPGETCFRIVGVTQCAL
jgi:hypothetical protein